MGIISKLLFGDRKKPQVMQPAIAFKPVIPHVKNPFPEARNRILGFDSELISIAASGNHDALDRALQTFLSELTMYNSNISRYLVREFKQRITLPAGNSNPVRAALVQELFLEHNKAYVSIRHLVKALREEAPLLSQPTSRIDDLNLLDESQNQAVFGSLLNIRISLTVIEDIWEKLIPYEQQLFNQRS